MKNSFCNNLLALFLFFILFVPRPLAKTTQHDTNQQELGVITHGLRTSNKVALTFDADMTPKMKKDLETKKVSSWFNREVVDILKRDNASATFFVTGMWAQIYDKELKELAHNQLFEIENHSYSHPGFATPCYGLRPVNQKDKSGEISEAQNIITKITGRAPIYFRFPGGCAKTADIKLVEKYNLSVVHWDVISGDAFGKNADIIISHVLKKTRGGSIIVFHLNGGPNAPKTAEALEPIISGLKGKGFQLVTVSDILHNNAPTQ